jgi:hypothetical protein
MSRLGVVFSAVIVLALATTAWADDQERSRSSDKSHCILDALAAKIKLTDAQKAQFRKIHDEAETKAKEPREQLHRLRHEEHEALSKVLTEQQRKDAKRILKEDMDAHIKDIENKLGLQADQRQEAAKILADYERKREALATEKNAGNLKDRKHALDTEEFEALCMVLTSDQRAHLPGALKEEFHARGGRRQFRMDFADKLGLTADQKTQWQKIFSEFDPKIEKPRAQLRQTWKDTHAAMEKVLDETQRAEFKRLVSPANERQKSE